MISFFQAFNYIVHFTVYSALWNVEAASNLIIFIQAVYFVVKHSSNTLVSPHFPSEPVSSYLERLIETGSLEASDTEATLARLNSFL